MKERTTLIWYEFWGEKNSNCFKNKTHESKVFISFSENDYEILLFKYPEQSSNESIIYFSTIVTKKYSISFISFFSWCTQIINWNKHVHQHGYKMTILLFIVKFINGPQKFTNLKFRCKIKTGMTFARRPNWFGHMLEFGMYSFANEMMTKAVFCMWKKAKKEMHSYLFVNWNKRNNNNMMTIITDNNDSVHVKIELKNCICCY